MQYTTSLRAVSLIGRANQYMDVFYQSILNANMTCKNILDQMFPLHQWTLHFQHLQPKWCWCTVQNITVGSNCKSKQNYVCFYTKTDYRVQYSCLNIVFEHFQMSDANESVWGGKMWICNHTHFTLWTVRGSWFHPTNSFSISISCSQWVEEERENVTKARKLRVFSIW